MNKNLKVFYQEKEIELKEGYNKEIGCGIYKINGINNSFKGYKIYIGEIEITHVDLNNLDNCWCREECIIAVE